MESQEKGDQTGYPVSERDKELEAKLIAVSANPHIYNVSITNNNTTIYEKGKEKTKTKTVITASTNYLEDNQIIKYIREWFMEVMEIDDMKKYIGDRYISYSKMIDDNYKIVLDVWISYSLKDEEALAILSEIAGCELIRTESTYKNTSITCKVKNK